MELLARLFTLCIALASVEMLHGIARVRFVSPRLGQQRAKRLSIITGSLLALGVCFLLVPPLGLTRPTALLGIGLAIAAFMASFDVAVAHWLMRRPWASIPEDFDPRRGNFLVFGLLALLLAPNLVMALFGRS